MTAKQPFFPHYGSNQVVAPAAASAFVPISADDRQVRILNTGANVAHFRTYDTRSGAQVATTADFPVGPNQSSTLTCGPSHNAIAFISAAGTTCHLMTGEGF